MAPVATADELGAFLTADRRAVAIVTEEALRWAGNRPASPSPGENVSAGTRSRW